MLQSANINVVAFNFCKINVPIVWLHVTACHQLSINVHTVYDLFTFQNPAATQLQFIVQSAPDNVKLVVVHWLNCQQLKTHHVQSVRFLVDVQITLNHLQVNVCQAKFSVHAENDTDEFDEVELLHILKSSENVFVHELEKVTPQSPIIDFQFVFIVFVQENVIVLPFVKDIHVLNVNAQDIERETVVLKPHVYPVVQFQSVKSIDAQNQLVHDNTQSQLKFQLKITTSAEVGIATLSRTQLALHQFVGVVAFQSVELPQPTQYLFAI